MIDGAPAAQRKRWLNSKLVIGSGLRNNIAKESDMGFAGVGYSS